MLQWSVALRAYGKTVFGEFDARKPARNQVGVAITVLLHMTTPYGFLRA
jgi:hypothetical protein